MPIMPSFLFPNWCQFLEVVRPSDVRQNWENGRDLRAIFINLKVASLILKYSSSGTHWRRRGRVHEDLAPSPSGRSGGADADDDGDERVHDLCRG